MHPQEPSLQLARQEQTLKSKLPQVRWFLRLSWNSYAVPGPPLATVISKSLRPCQSTLTANVPKFVTRFEYATYGRRIRICGPTAVISDTSDWNFAFAILFSLPQSFVIARWHADLLWKPFQATEAVPDQPIWSVSFFPS